ncbi:MAG TPA: hypothetical protein VK151_11070 [Fluviicola sp.]|nr:hypothetical protein [Fluviicola sp.]
MPRLVSISLILFCLHARAQDYVIDWVQDSRRSISQIVDIFPQNGTNFFTYQLSNSQLLQAPKVTRYENGQPIITKRIEQHIENNMVILEELVVFNGSLLGFLSDKKDGVNSLYMVKYDTEIDPLGDPEVITSYPKNKGLANRGFFNVLTSRNKKYLCVEYVIPGKRDHFDRYGYKVMDSAFRVVTEGEYEIPYNARNASVDVRYLTDNGDYILGISVYSNTNIGVWKDYNALEKTVVVHVKGDEFSEYELSIEDKRVFDIGVNALDSILVVTGTYGEEMSSGSQGVFMMRINLAEKKIRQQYFELFPRDFMTQDMTPNEIDRLERREDRGRLGPQLYNYMIRSIYPLDDGSTIVVAEQFYLYQQTTTDARGISQSVSHYYYNDVISYKIDAGGKFNWMVRIPKEQHSVNDYGYYSSIKSFVDKGKLVVFFNDNIANYDEFGVYEGFNRSISFPVRKKSYTLSKCEVDIASGEVNRISFNDYNATQGYVIPRLSTIDYPNRQVLFYAQGRLDRFGILQY